MRKTETMVVGTCMLHLTSGINVETTTKKEFLHDNATLQIRFGNAEFKADYCFGIADTIHAIRALTRHLENLRKLEADVAKANALLGKEASHV